MARKRTGPMWRKIYDTIPTSSLTRCSLLAHAFGPHLVYVVDMWGICSANPKWVCNSLFEGRDDVDVETVASWLDEWEACGYIERRESEGRRWLRIVSWDKWQPGCVKERRGCTPPSCLDAFCTEQPPAPPSAHPEEAPHPPAEVPPVISPDSPSIHPGFTPDSPTENPQREGEGEKRERGRGREESEIPLPPSSLHSGPIPKQAASDAEQLLGRPLSDADKAFLRRWARDDGYPEEWICLAIRTSLEREKRKMSYVDGVLRGYRSDGGPPLPKARPAVPCGAGGIGHGRKPYRTADMEHEL